jgi:hypothetical protein
MLPAERTGRDESGHDWLTSERPKDYTTERHLQDLVREAAIDRGAGTRQPKPAVRHDGPPREAPPA